MKIIVTGGAGFIASHVVDKYVQAGHKVVVIDNLNTGFRRNLNPKATFYEADIRDLPLMEKIFKKEKPEIVNHHAALAEVVKSVRNPIPTYEVNVIGMANVLLCFGQFGKGKNKKFIFSSTGGAIYGEPKKIPAAETVPPMPLSPYGLSKLLGEELIHFYAYTYKFPYYIFRYANIYGPRQNPKGEAGVVAIFGSLMKKGGQPIIFGDGSKARDYVYVDDVVEANLKALRHGKNITTNIGWGKLVSDKMIFETIAKAIDFKKAVKYAPYRAGEVYRISLDATKARKTLHWAPKVTLQEGIQRTLETL